MFPEEIHHVKASYRLLVAMVFVGTVSVAVAATAVWNGEGSTTDWSDGDNWVSNSPPDSTDDVEVLDTTPQNDSEIDTSFFQTNVNSLTIGRGHTLDVKKKLEINVKLSVIGDVTITGDKNLVPAKVQIGADLKGGSIRHNGTGTICVDIPACEI